MSLETMSLCQQGRGTWVSQGEDTGVSDGGHGRVGWRTRACWMEDTGVLDGGHGRVGWRTRACWMEDTGVSDGGHGRVGWRTRACWMEGMGVLDGGHMLGEDREYDCVIMIE